MAEHFKYQENRNFVRGMSLLRGVSLEVVMGAYRVKDFIRHLVFTLIACSSVVGPEERVLGPQLPDLGIDPATLQYVREVIFVRQCTFASSCHGQQTRDGELMLGTVVDGRDVPWDHEQENLLLDQLLGEDRTGHPVANPYHPGRLRVVPGNCAESYLIQKLEGRDLVGPCPDDGPMPQNSDCEPTVPGEYIAMVCRWIKTL